MSPEEIDTLREEAQKLVDESDGQLPAMRSCWECNAAHEHLKQSSDVVFVCFECGRFYYKGEYLSS